MRWTPRARLSCRLRRYLVSAYFIYRTTIPQRTDTPDGPVLRTAMREMGGGWRYLRTVPGVGRIALVKATWATAGGALVYGLTLLGNEVAPQAMRWLMPCVVKGSRVDCWRPFSWSRWCWSG